MPCRISNDVHERINELATVPTLNSVKLRKTENGLSWTCGERRPCGVLLQFVLVIFPEMQSVVGSLDVILSGMTEQRCNTNLLRGYN
jgi:hypothetical protein